MTTMVAPTKIEQIRLARRSPAYWRVTIDNPINVMGQKMVRQFQEVIDALETDEHVRVLVFDCAVNDYGFVEALAAQIAKFDKWTIANTKRLVNTSLPPDVEFRAGGMRASLRLGDPLRRMGSKR
jgi:hypothetical protein